MSEWQDWIGREERRADRIDAGLVARWLATFDRAPGSGDAVPQGLHWCLCTPDAPTAQLGTDGHPRRDDSPLSLLPPVPLPRRMWAASRMEFLAPLRLDANVERTTQVLSISEKSGATGRLVFVDLGHETRSNGELAVREVQSLVYRAAPEPGTPPAPPPPGPDQFLAEPWSAHRRLVPSETLLFRFSALTFNSHRIHYDTPYATGPENYRGLVVHGPLTATLLLDLAQRELGDNALKTFAFRGLSPAICGEALHLAMRGDGQGFELGAFAADGRAVMSASVT